MTLVGFARLPARKAKGKLSFAYNDLSVTLLKIQKVKTDCVQCFFL